MNYPVRKAVLGFLTGKEKAGEVARQMESLYENYPRENFMSELNLLGSHDRRRLLTLLGNAPAPEQMGDDQRYGYRLTEQQHGLAVSRLWDAAVLQMCLPGVPSIYYGDEAGMEGYADPYCRAPFPWDNINRDCFNIYRNAIAIRKTLPALVDGDFEPFAEGDDVFGFWRRNETDEVCVLVNASLSDSHKVRIPVGDLCADDVVSGRVCEIKDGMAEVYLWPLGTAVLNLHPQERLQAPMERGLGVLCHITSLPSPDNQDHPGTLGEPAIRFIDEMSKAGARYWQVLPVNPTDGFGSPYAGLSAFAGNVRLMWGVDGDRPTQLKTDFEGTPDFRRFVEQNEKWLIPYATFRAIKDLMGEKPWQEWPAKYHEWKPSLSRDKKLARGIKRVVGLQYSFMRQWNDMRHYANDHGIKIIGDMPMYVSADSADVWANRELFNLDEKGNPSQLAGVPPDSFAEDGQIWGNPTYQWRYMKETGYEWWMRRLARAFELYDYVRLDHFLGFSSYYTIPQGEKATKGQWNFAPGLELFQAAYKKFGPLPVIAEDLGSITPAVRALMSKTGFPGMDVIQFSDEDVREGYHPKPGKLVYTSTHDTNTMLGWVESKYNLDKNDPEQLRQAMVLAEELIIKCVSVKSDVVMLPLQDLLMLDGQARMNVPGVATGNWKWQAGPWALEDASLVMDALVQQSGR